MNFMDKLRGDMLIYDTTSWAKRENFLELLGDSVTH